MIIMLKVEEQEIIDIIQNELGEYIVYSDNQKQAQPSLKEKIQAVKKISAPKAEVPMSVPIHGGNPHMSAEQWAKWQTANETRDIKGIAIMKANKDDREGDVPTGKGGK